MARLPGVDARTMVIGRTGEGKTVGGLFLLAYQNWSEMPWVIIDYKRDKLIAMIETAGAKVLYDNRTMEGKPFPPPPVEPGLYIVRPDPDQREEVNSFLFQMWRQGRVGLFCDEAFMIPQKRPFKAYDALLTQGRSLECPMIMLYQRPVDMSQFATSQADFWMVYNLHKPEDIAKANEYVGSTVGSQGETIDVTTKLPRYYWLWYDVSADECAVMQPVPGPADLIGVFRQRLTPATQARVVTEEGAVTAVQQEERAKFSLY